jgi:hypothetical protein
MKTRHQYIYRYTSGYRVKFLQNDVCVQKSFSGEKALQRAVKFRDSEFPDIHKLNSRRLQVKPQRWKSSNLPAGISLFENSKRISITAGYDNNKRLIQRNIRVSKYPSYDDAVRDAIKVRIKLTQKFGKRIRQQ